VPSLEDKRKVTDEFIRRDPGPCRESRQGQHPLRDLRPAEDLHSIYRKIKSQGIDIGQVYDYIAFRS